MNNRNVAADILEYRKGKKREKIGGCGKVVMKLGKDIPLYICEVISKGLEKGMSMEMI